MFMLIGFLYLCVCLVCCVLLDVAGVIYVQYSSAKEYTFHSEMLQRFIGEL